MHTLLIVHQVPHNRLTIENLRPCNLIHSGAVILDARVSLCVHVKALNESENSSHQGSHTRRQELDSLD